MGWALNRGTKGQHSYETLGSLGNEIKDMKKGGGDYEDIVEVLNKHKDIAPKDHLLINLKIVLRLQIEMENANNKLS
ncbi:hypothetical protein [Clostridium gasigenes]|uniref:hypothetical protein n=1 Tax=Clostridium gasigenes TaxID=94869 RepID=UPI001C0B9E1D|nr:hypothetical protein [Clostridium gasigenes]MBU3107982.1 hypothetical protein [Clostridium gasigenes]